MLFISGTFGELPLFQWPVAIVLVIFLALVVRGYQLGLGFGLISIGPGTNGQSIPNGHPAIGGYSESTRPSIAQVRFECNA